MAYCHGSQEGNETGNASDQHMISQDQYNHLMDMIQKQNVNNGTQNPNNHDSTSTAMLAGKVLCSMISITQPLWILDSGATDHITPHLSHFTTYKRVTGPQNHISTANGHQAEIKHIGSVRLKHNLVLHNVLHVPDFRFNLISINKLTSHLNCQISFSSSHCFIQVHSMSTPMLLGKHKNGLYYVDTQLKKEDDLYNTNIVANSTVMPFVESSANKFCNGVSLSDQNSYCNVSHIPRNEKFSLLLWHLRLGHLPFNKLHLIPGMPSGTLNTHICHVCPQAHQTRKTFPTSSIKTHSPFELIHIDTWGPYKYPTHAGHKYFLTIVDDFSRCTWTHLMQSKTNAISIIKSILAYAQTHFNTKIKTIRTDNALELCEGYAKQFYRENGIEHQTSIRDTPQQNGVVERKHRHLLETARALQFQSNLPIKFWGECILTATYLINRFPLKSLKHKTPFEVFLKQNPDYSHLRSFGCLCYVSTLKKDRHKFSPRATPCVFMGYPNGQKGYKVLDLGTGSLFTSRDITFHENIFPFHLNNFPPTSNIPHSFTLDPIYIPTSSDPSDIMPTHTTPPLNETHSPTTSPSSPTVSHLSPHLNHSAPLSPPPNIPPSSQPLTPPLSTTTSSPSHLPDLTLRRSSRITKPPSYLHDYDTTLSTSLITGHWCNLIPYSELPNRFHALVSTIASNHEPRSYFEAVSNPAWQQAMQAELTALSNNDTWDLVDLPKGKKAIGSRWVYKLKFRNDGTIDRYKARLVARGFSQIPGIDFDEKFSPVVKMTTIRCLIAIAAARSWHLHQLDVNNAFLHGDLHEEVYMKAPDGFPNPHHRVCKLKKSIYGLKQASRQWFAKLTGALLSQGFSQSKNDYSMFIHRQDKDLTILIVYVDDLLITGSNSTLITHLKHFLATTFSIKDLGKARYFLGFELAYLPEGISLTQHKFTHELLTEPNLPPPKPAATPLPLNLKISQDDGNLIPDPSVYRSLIGKLNFLTHTRPDISYAVQTLSQFMQKPHTAHLSALYHLLSYIHHTHSQGILLRAIPSLTLQAFSDSDWGSCPDTRKSLTGYVLLLGGSPISWKSKKHSTISKSSSEAEYRAMAHAAAEITWVVRLLSEMGLNSLTPVTLHCDNQSAIHIGKNPVFHERTKHIDIDCHFTREKVLEGLIQLTYLPTRSQIADIFTKILPSSQFQELMSKLGMVDFHSPFQLAGG